MTSETIYKISENAVRGRQLVARRKIFAGEIIIDEPALLTGPGFARGSQHVINPQRKSSVQVPAKNDDGTNDFTQEDASVCMVCCKNLLPSSCIRCSSCGLLLCSEYCKNDIQHSKNECLILPKIPDVMDQKVNRSKKALYNLVLVIRGLYYKFRDGTKWAQINNLDSKSEALVKVGGFTELQDIFSSLSWEMFSSSSGSPSETKDGNFNNDDEGANNENIVDAAKHCLGVMRINAFSSFSESYSREGLFFISSFMSHSCVINTDRQIGVVNGDVSGSRMVVRASVDIEKDEPITTTYLSLLYNTEERHRIMISSWLFVCNCKRCQDPMECQAFSATMICQKGVNKSKSLDSLTCCDNNADCSDCTSSNKEAIIEQIIKSRPLNLYDITEVENWLDTYDNGKLLHPNHSLFVHIKLFLCQYYGRQNGGMNELSVSQLQRKGKYCQQILNLYDKVCAGLQMCRGVLLFELWCTLQKLAELKEPTATMSSINLPFVQNILPSTIPKAIDIIEVKKKALKILQFALPNSPEEAMANYLLEDGESVT